VNHVKAQQAQFTLINSLNIDDGVSGAWKLIKSAIIAAAHCFLNNDTIFDQKINLP
jgi:hypothetical protein